MGIFSRKKTILIINDEETITHNLKHYLKAFHLIITDNYHHALHKLHKADFVIAKHYIDNIQNELKTRDEDDLKKLIEKTHDEHKIIIGLYINSHNDYKKMTKDQRFDFIFDLAHDNLKDLRQKAHNILGEPQ